MDDIVGRARRADCSRSWCRRSRSGVAVALVVWWSPVPGVARRGRAARAFTVVLVRAQARRRAVPVLRRRRSLDAPVGPGRDRPQRRARRPRGARDRVDRRARRRPRRSMWVACSARRPPARCRPRADAAPVRSTVAAQLVARARVAERARPWSRRRRRRRPRRARATQPITLEADHEGRASRRRGAPPRARPGPGRSAAGDGRGAAAEAGRDDAARTAGGTGCRAGRATRRPRGARPAPGSSQLGIRNTNAPSSSTPTAPWTARDSPFVHGATGRRRRATRRDPTGRLPPATAGALFPNACQFDYVCVFKVRDDSRTGDAPGRRRGTASGGHGAASTSGGAEALGVSRATWTSASSAQDSGACAGTASTSPAAGSAPAAAGCGSCSSGSCRSASTSTTGSSTGEPDPLRAAAA